MMRVEDRRKVIDLQGEERGVSIVFSILRSCDPIYIISDEKLCLILKGEVG